MFNLKEFLEAATPTGAVVILITPGIVNWFGDLGVKGRGLLVTSMLSGLVLGGLALFFQITPVTAAEYFGVVVFGITCGLGASGLYNAQKTAARKGTISAIITPPTHEEVAAEIEKTIQK